MAEKGHKPTGGGVKTPKSTPSVLYPAKGMAKTIKVGGAGATAPSGKQGRG